MILQSGYECYLTQSADVPASERVFLTETRVLTVDDFLSWREVTRKEKETMQAQSAFIDVENMNVDSLERVNCLLADIRQRINVVPLSTGQALQQVSFFPEWFTLIGQTLPVEFRLQYGGILYEVIQEHTVQEDWSPASRAISLYKVVQVEAEGTLEDPIMWEQGMELFKGKYYMDNGILYECTRDSGMAMYYSLQDLVLQEYVKLAGSEGVDRPVSPGEAGNSESSDNTNDPNSSGSVNKEDSSGPVLSGDTTPSQDDTATAGSVSSDAIPEDGSPEHPFSFSQGMAIEQGLHYVQFGITYLCIQSSPEVYFDLKDVTALVQTI